MAEEPLACCQLKSCRLLHNSRPVIIVSVSMHTKFEVSGFTHSKNMIGIPKILNGSQKHDNAFQACFVVHRLGLATINLGLPLCSLVSSLATACRKWGDFKRWFKVVGNVTTFYRVHTTYYSSSTELSHDLPGQWCIVGSAPAPLARWTRPVGLSALALPASLV